MFNHHRGLWGYTGAAPGRRAADDPGDRHGRTVGGDRADGADRDGRAPGGEGGHLRGARPEPRAGRAGDRRARRSAPTAPRARSARASGSPPTRADVGAARQAARARARAPSSASTCSTRTGRPAPGARRSRWRWRRRRCSHSAARRAPVGCVLAVSDTFDADGERRRIDDDELLRRRRADGRGRDRGAVGANRPCPAAGPRISASLATVPLRERPPSCGPCRPRAAALWQRSPAWPARALRLFGRPRLFGAMPALVAAAVAARRFRGAARCGGGAAPRQRPRGAARGAGSAARACP